MNSLLLQGREFDLDGNLAEWWEPQTEQAYLERAQCFINGNYSFLELGMKVHF